MGVITTTRLSEGTVFGPISTNLTLADPAILIGHRTCDTLPDIHTVKLDVREHSQGSRLSEWVPYVQAARDFVEQNMEAFRIDGQLYFRIMKDISENSELLIWYSPKFAIQLGLPELKEEFRKGDVFCCPRCRETFQYPNCLRAHLKFRCRFRNQTTNTTSLPRSTETSDTVATVPSITLSSLMTSYDGSKSWPICGPTTDPVPLSPPDVGRGSPTASPVSRSSPPGSGALRLTKRKPDSCEDLSDVSPKRSVTSSVVMSSSPSPNGSASSSFDGGYLPAGDLPGGARSGTRGGGVQDGFDDRTKSAFQRVDKLSSSAASTNSKLSSVSSCYVTMTSSVLTPTTALNMTSLVDKSLGGIPGGGMMAAGGGGAGMLMFPHFGRLPLPAAALVANENSPYYAAAAAVNAATAAAAFTGLQYLNNNNKVMKLPYQPSPATDPSRLGGLPFLYRSPNPMVDKMLQVVGSSGGPMQSTFPALSLTQNWCAKCNTSFRMTSDLVYHMRSHHKREFDPVKKKKDDKLKCDVCGESFRERHHLTRHMTSHT